VLPVVTVRDFSGSATCYADLNGRGRPGAVAQKTSASSYYTSSHVSMYRIRRLIVVIACTTFALLLGFPVALYSLGLSGVESRPQKPLQLASAEQKAAVWKRARGEGTPYVTADNPYSYGASVFFASVPRTPPGQLVTWWVARDYLVRHKRYKGMGWWHLSGAALAIWLSCNWTSDEILSAAAQLHQSASGRKRT
jgi:hypothetical protein